MTQIPQKVVLFNSVTRQNTYNITLRCVRVKIAAAETMSIAYSECVSVVLSQLHGMQIVSLLHRVKLPYVVCLALPYFST